jgi:branched-chain amino acid transport system substrate-binding protein
VQNRPLMAIAAASAVAALALAGCSSSGSSSPGGNNSSSSGGGLNTSSGGGLNGSSSNGGGNPTYTLGFIGALSGPYAQLGINEKQGASLAIDQANTSGKYPFTIKFDPQDSEGDPAKAPAAATALISDPNVIGVIGPAFSGESEAVDPSFCHANPPMPIVTASASEAALSTKGYTCWHRIISNDNVEGTQGADWLARTGAHKVYVLNDLSAYGAGVAATMASELRKKGVQVITNGVDGTSTKNYNPIAQTITASGADALFYGGYDANTALLVKALRAANFKGRIVSGNGSKDSTFTKNAGKAGNGVYFTCGCQDATKAPSAKAFTAAYQKMWHQAPSTYSPEAYDAANLFIDAINNLTKAGTPVNRTTLLQQINKEDYKGITTEIKFRPNGEIVNSSLTVGLYQQQKGQIVGLGDITKAK